MLLTGAAGAQTPQPAPAAPRAPEYYSAATLAATADSLRAQHTVARVLGDRGTYQYVLVVRDTTPVPEQHAKWTDVMLVQAGSATVLLGGQYEGGREETPGETRGGRLVGANAQAVAAGDLIVDSRGHAAPGAGPGAGLHPLRHGEGAGAAALSA